MRGPKQGLGNVEAQIANTQKLAISQRKDKQKDILERDDHFYKLYCRRRDKMTRFIASQTMIGAGIGKFHESCSKRLKRKIIIEVIDKNI